MPSARGVCWQPLAWQLSSVHGLPSSQLAGVHTAPPPPPPPPPPPALQAGVLTGTCPHCPLVVSHVSVVQGLPSSQFDRLALDALTRARVTRRRGAGVAACCSSPVYPCRRCWCPVACRRHPWCTRSRRRRAMPFNGAFTHPTAGLQLSCVHGLLSSQSGTGAGWQPSVESQVWGWQRSPPTHDGRAGARARGVAGVRVVSGARCRRSRRCTPCRLAAVGSRSRRSRRWRSDRRCRDRCRCCRRRSSVGVVVTLPGRPDCTTRRRRRADDRRSPGRRP